VSNTHPNNNLDHQKVRDRDFLKPDDELGRVELPLARLAETVTAGARGLAEGWFDLSRPGRGAAGGRGRIELRVQYRGY
jgi:hypothetical protein